ncbi:DUF4914 family protein [Anaerocolumna aminovalerica]|uniref:DUF4914 domain-containing protein n=1 Tax=Anaerocolumna aminovalerica TaxID=1527 RepID=A0A1I5EQQ6_9FIRM|nr:DUF4914 family protein [Anaerocolumna aminovalerica]MBU5334714.1 DUF4914 family protein [Anaerocolumna aminovalerica]MDU6266208.1 DUF4914 family protein [Anaerocolumna aminovalerica]SFO13828.1 protein of unknown function [Anaerocolumna aminovalerica]
MKSLLEKLNLPNEVQSIIQNSKKVVVAKNREELLELSYGSTENDEFHVSYDVKGKGSVQEVTVNRCKNGAVVNYLEDYMRRRDPDCLIVSDELGTDKPKFKDFYKADFEPLRQETFDWLKEQELIVLPFMSGGKEYGYESLLIAPLNAAFFACAVADIQGYISVDEIPEGFSPKAIVYLAPPFRHTHFGGKQVVVHNRSMELHEVFSYNLYPGPSAKKGIYGVLLNIGEREGWTTVHASTVRVITPYDNELVILHEGASGGGKSEMTEDIHRELDGRIVLGTNTLTGEKNYIDIVDTCEVQPVTDDMALCHPKMQNESKKLVVQDAEQGWFLRLDNIKKYGSSPKYESIIVQPSEKLLFFNLDGVSNATCLPWEHTLDSNGKPCPNPRVILPRKMVQGIVSEPVEVDVRSFGVRVPPCTKEQPSYGIIGLFHILPPAIAWLWRLVAPRGYNNPSITSTQGMTSEGVGSYWPFATGKKVTQANLLLNQITSSTHTRYVLIPNQHIGAYEVGFMPEWIAREYIARRGSAKFKQEHLTEARCKLLGYCHNTLKLDGHYIRRAFLQPEMQSEVGLEGYDKGAEILTDFFKKELAQYNTEDLNPLGKQIIDCFMRDGSLEEYCDILPMRF